MRAGVPQIGETWDAQGRQVTIRLQEDVVTLRCARAFGDGAEARMSVHTWMMMDEYERRELVRAVAIRATYAHEMPQQPPDRQERESRVWWHVSSA